MANWNDPRNTSSGLGGSPSLNGTTIGRAASYDIGLRRHMLSIYNYMASGVLLSGIVAFVFANYGLAAAMINSPVKWLVMLAPLGFVFASDLMAAEHGSLGIALTAKKCLVV